MLDTALEGIGHAMGTVKGEEYADGQCQSAFLQRIDMLGQLRTEHREIIGGAFYYVGLQLRVAVAQIFGQGGQDQEQREQRQESIVGQQGRLTAGIVLIVLLDDGDNEGGQAMAPLEAIDFLYEFLQNVKVLPVITAQPA